MFDSFPVCRTLFNHWIYDNPDYLKIWITMLGRARYSKEIKKGIYQSVNYELGYGQFIFGRIQWSEDLRLGEQKIRTCIKKMLTDNMISLTRHTMNFTIYEVVNYAKFNSLTNTDLETFDENSILFQKNTNYNHPDYLGVQGIQGEDNQRITNGKPTDNQRITTKEEGSKKVKKVKKDIYTTTQFKFPTIEEVKAYCLKRNNNVDANKWHDFYSSKGWMVGRNKMKDWEAAVRTWEHKDKQANQPVQKNVTEQWSAMRKAAKGE